jgi:hypothetical protein
MSSSRHWSDFPVRALYPHQEKNFMSGAKLIAKWRITAKQLAELLQDQDFLAFVSPFYEDQPEACERDVLSLKFDPEELLRYAKIFLPENYLFPYPESKPQLQRATGKADDAQSMQRRYWRTRAVAQFLWTENKNLLIAEMATHGGVFEYGCENAGVDHETIKTWIQELCPNESDPSYKRTPCEVPGKPKMKPAQRHRERCRALAALSWGRPENAKENVAGMGRRPEFTEIGCEGKQYSDPRTVQDYIRDLCPSTTEERRGRFPRKPK